MVRSEKPKAESSPDEEIARMEQAGFNPGKHGFDQIPILAVGRGWMVADKPAGMSIHNAPGEDLCSLVSEKVRQRPDIGELFGIDPPNTGFGADIHPVHRLDRETSGVVLLAADREIFRFFSKQFTSRTVIKTYVALVHGRLEMPGGADSWGIWEWPLSKTAAGRSRPQGVGRRHPSSTRYRVLGHSEHYTMVSLELLTGRTHQIRRHAKLAGHPVVGDVRYGSDRAVNFLRKQRGFDRLALHARALSIQLPGKDDQTTIETRTIPNQMRILFEEDWIGREEATKEQQ
ncbi:MAG: RluA family pseudouridine synthase [Thermodesulfobacteriota bacterium]